MKYILRKAVLGDVPQIEIDRDEFENYEESKNILNSCRTIEETYEMIISNFSELEKQILTDSADRMIRPRAGYESHFNMRLQINIKLANLLTSARLYYEQAPSNVEKCLPGERKVCEKVHKIFKDEKKENKYLRFMIALRNYVQHHGLPIHLTRVNSSLSELDEHDEEFLKFSLEFASENSRLVEDEDFDESLNDFSEKIDLKKSTRSCVESLSKIHSSIREMIEDSVAEARKSIEEARKRYSDEYEGDLVGLKAKKIDSRESVESFSLTLEWDNIRKKLQDRNQEAVNLTRRFVTNEITDLNN